MNSYSSDNAGRRGRPRSRRRARDGAAADQTIPRRGPVMVAPVAGTERRARHEDRRDESLHLGRAQPGRTVAAAGGYQARLRAGDTVLTQPFTVLIDPNVAADGVTVADLKEQFEHNMRIRELVVAVNQTMAGCARRRVE